MRPTRPVVLERGIHLEDPWEVRIPPERDPGWDPDLVVVRLAQRPATRRAAMTILYERYRGRVYGAALGLVRDPNDASDVLQDVFVTLLREVGRFRASSRFSSWLHRITVNASIDRLRRRRTRPRPTAHTDLLDASEDHFLTAPERAFSRRELRAQVRNAVEHLSDPMRFTARLRYMEGLSYLEIAGILDCSIGTVKSRLHRAHTALRHILETRHGCGPDAGPPDVVAHRRNGR